MQKEIDIQIPVEECTVESLNEYSKRFCEDLDIEPYNLPGVYNIYDLIKTCSSKTCYDPQWGILAGRMLNNEINRTCGKTFSESTRLLKSQLNKEYYDFVQANAHLLDPIENPQNSRNRQSIAVFTCLKSYLRRYSKCGGCKQCNDCEILWVGENIEQMYLRVATFLAMPDIDRIYNIYNSLSLGYHSCATPTLYNAGAIRHQMASCFVGTVADNLHTIEDYWVAFGEISRNAGGIGCDFSRIRHSLIGNVGKSDGVAALLPTYQSILRYVDQSKKRKGSAAVFLAIWHIDIESIIKMKDPKGADSNNIKCLDLNYCVWANDVFFKRVQDNAKWSLFCPAQCPGLSETYGDEFAQLYCKYESEGKYIKQVDARHLLFEIINVQIATGEPYLSNADTINRCNMQSNIGLIRSSNLCQEVLLHTSDTEIASCNLASLCLPKFVHNREFDYTKFVSTIRLVVRMLDNVVSRNYYPDRELEIRQRNRERIYAILDNYCGPVDDKIVDEIVEKMESKEILQNIKNANLRNRPLGIGVQGLGDAIAKMDLCFDSPEAMELNNKISQYLYYYAVDESANIARELGNYPRFAGSPYESGILHPDKWVSPSGKSAVFLEELDWDALREKVKGGMRNSTLIAYMPTASTSIIAGNSPAAEPINCIIGTKTILSGQHVVLSNETYNDFKKLGVWTPRLVKEIMDEHAEKEEDGVVGVGGIQHLSMPPEIADNPLKRARFNYLLQKYRTAYELSTKCILNQAIARTPFTCQSQSMNLFINNPSIKQLMQIYNYGWQEGLKTLVYYLRGTAGTKARNISGGCKGDSCSG